MLRKVFLTAKGTNPLIHKRGGKGEGAPILVKKKYNTLSERKREKD